MKAAIYARFSSDLQNERSIDDQVALCRLYAERHGLTVAGIYDDRAVSGASTVARTGWRRLMQDAAGRRFDIVLAEDIDRISRDEADWHDARKRLTFLGIAIHTAHTGPIGGIEGSVRAMMASYFLENLAHKVRRGQAGVVRQGRHAGGRAYGYRPQPGRPGEFVIEPAEAAVVLRIHGDYADGMSPRDIAGALNREGVPPPRGTAWNASTINGSRQRGTGILNNELYRGRLVWNRVHMVKDPDTGRRVSRPNGERDWQRVDVPHLAIVPADLAGRVDAQRTARTAAPRARSQPRHMLSGLLRCGLCGAGMAVHDRDRHGRARIRCSRHVESGTCNHARRYMLADIERTVLDGLRHELRDPVLIRSFVERYRQKRRELAAAEDAGRARAARRLGEIDRSLRRLVDALASGAAPFESMRETMAAMEEERRTIRNRLAAPPDAATTIALHPAAVAGYLDQLDRLADALADRDGIGGAVALYDAFRRLVARVIVHPVAARQPLDIEIAGSLAELMSAPDLPPSARFGGGSGGSGGVFPSPSPPFYADFVLRVTSRAA